MVITKVEFAKKCGDNNECESNLVMDVSLDLRHDTNGKPVLEQGITKELRVMVTIENTYEVAYQIMFYFTKPETLKYESSEPVSTCLSFCLLVCQVFFLGVLSFLPHLLIGLPHMC